MGVDVCPLKTRLQTAPNANKRPHVIGGGRGHTFDESVNRTPHVIDGGVSAEPAERCALGEGSLGLRDPQRLPTETERHPAATECPSHERFNTAKGEQVGERPSGSLSPLGAVYTDPLTTIKRTAFDLFTPAVWHHLGHALAPMTDGEVGEGTVHPKGEWTGL